MLFHSLLALLHSAMCICVVRVTCDACELCMLSVCCVLCVVCMLCVQHMHFKGNTGEETVLHIRRIQSRRLATARDADNDCGVSKGIFSPGLAHNLGALTV